MRVIFLALAVLLLALAYFLPAITTGLPLQFEAWRNLILVAVGVWLAIEAWVASRRARAHLSRSEQHRLELEAANHKVEAQRTELERVGTVGRDYEKRLADAQHRAAQAEQRVQGAERQAAEAEQRNDELKRALDDARGRLAAAEAAATAAPTRSAEDEVVTLLSLLQQKGRFIDFIMDDITKYPDAQVGAAARVVHQGCSSVVREYFDIHPVHEGVEGAPLTLGKEYDAHRYRLLGRVTGEAPFAGRLLHHGWLTASVKLPETLTPRGAGSTPGIIAPAEVELH